MDSDSQTIEEQNVQADSEVRDFAAAHGGQTPAEDFEQHLGVQRHLLARAALQAQGNSARGEKIASPPRDLVDLTEDNPALGEKRKSQTEPDTTSSEAGCGKTNKAGSETEANSGKKTKSIGSAGREAAPVKGVLSGAKLREVRNLKDSLIPDITGGPWNSTEPEEAWDVLKTEVKKWANRFDTGGGNHGVQYTSYKPANSARGARRTAICDNKKKCQCAWRAVFEFSTDEGWVLVDGHNVHSHDLNTSQGEANASRASRQGIPADGGFLECGQAMAGGGCFVSKIDRVFRSMCEDQGKEPSWTYDELRQAFLPSSSQTLALDSSRFVEWMLQRKMTRALGCKHTTDESGRLDKAFFVLEDSDSLWKIDNGAADGGATNVLLFNTSHGTNRYGLKLGLLVTVDNVGVTHILAASVVTHEDVKSFKWVFEAFKEFFEHAPHVILTDGDPQMATAVKEYWPSCTHLLCTYHLGQNIIKNVRPLFRGKKSNKLFRHFLGEWWKVCKCTERRSQAKFDEDWKAIRNLIDTEYGQDSHAAKAYTAAVGQLTCLYDKRHQWAGRWTWSVFTAGCHSTQRQEAVHSGLKRWMLRPGVTLLTLAKQIVSYRDNIASKSAEKSLRQHLKNSKREIPFLLRPFTDNVSALCMDLMMAQYFDQDCQRIGPLNPTDNWDGIERNLEAGWKLSTREYVADTQQSDTQRDTDDDAESETESSSVQRTKQELSAVVKQFFNVDLGLPGVAGATLHDVSYACSKLECTCQLFTSLGIPCRHIFRLYNLAQDKHLPDSLIHPFWWQRNARTRTRSAMRSEEEGVRSRDHEVSKHDRYSRMMGAFQKLALDSCKSEADTLDVVKSIREMRLKLNVTDCEQAGKETLNTDNADSDTDDEEAEVSLAQNPPVSNGRVLQPARVTNDVLDSYTPEHIA